MFDQELGGAAAYDVASVFGPIVARGASLLKNVGRVKSTVPNSATGRYSHLPDHPSVGPGKPYTQSAKEKILQENMQRNGGVLRSDMSGEPLVRAQRHQRGVTPPSNEAHVDHIIERSAGGSNSFGNARVLSREENLSRPGRQ